MSTIDEEEKRAAKDVIDSGALTMGKNCREFEREFAAYLGVRNAVMVNSGSSANLLAIFALVNFLCPLSGGRRLVKPGDEIIVPALTWSTTIWPIIQAGAIPVFVDCDPDTLQVSPEAINAAITPKTTAIIIVHVLGSATDAVTVRDIADRHRLWLFEDTCESLGVRWLGRPVGTIGHLGSFSFYFSHHITTIEGGMVVTDDDDLAELLRAMRAHGWVRQLERPEPYIAANPEIDPSFLFISSGFNLRPTEINGAIGRQQLKKLGSFNEHRRTIARKLIKGLADLIDGGDLHVMQFDERCTPAPFGFPVLCRDAEARRGLQGHLAACGIETRPIICGNMVRQPAFRHIPHRVSATLAGADRVMDCGIYWGTHPKMNDEDIKYLVECVNGYFR